MTGEDDFVGLLAGIFLGLAGLAILSSIFGPKCPRCKKSLEKKVPICPHCGVNLEW